MHFDATYFRCSDGSDGCRCREAPPEASPAKAEALASSSAGSQDLQTQLAVIDGPSQGTAQSAAPSASVRIHECPAQIESQVARCSC